MVKRFEYHVPANETGALVGVIMGSDSDWPTMKRACVVLEKLRVRHEARVTSAHRTPDRMMEYAHSASSRGLKVIIAGAGGAAHLPGMVAGSTLLPVLGVPIESKALSGLDSLLSIVQMPKGVPTAAFSIGPAGAINAALFAARMLALTDMGLRERLEAYIQAQSEAVLFELPEDELTMEETK